MQIIPRDQLAQVLASPTFDPMAEFGEEMSAFAAAILADAPASITHFVFTDHENGDDPEVTFPEFGLVTRTLIGPEQWRKNGGSYYGLVVERKEFYSPEDPRSLYQCYLGGSPLNSAPGFVLSGATLAG